MNHDCDKFICILIIFSCSYYRVDQDFFKKEKIWRQRKRGEMNREEGRQRRKPNIRSFTVPTCRTNMPKWFFSPYLVQTLCWQVTDVGSRTGVAFCLHDPAWALFECICQQKHYRALVSETSLTVDITFRSLIQTVSNWCKSVAVYHAMDGDDKVRGAFQIRNDKTWGIYLTNSLKQKSSCFFWKLPTQYSFQYLGTSLLYLPITCICTEFFFTSSTNHPLV